MTCVECRAIRADQMKELFCDNKENCREAYQDGYNQALEDIFNLAKQNAYEDGVDYSISLQVLDELIEQLKEQNNDNGHL